MLTLDNPDQRNAMSDEMTASWVTAVDELAGRPVAAGGRGDRRGHRVLLRRQHRLDRQRARRRGRPAPHPDDRVLPGLAVDPAARGAHGRGGQRAGDRRRALPGAGLRPPVRRGVGPARRPVRAAGDEPRDGGDVPAPRRGRRGPRPGAAGHRPHRRRGGGAAARAGLGGARRRDVPRRRARDRRRASRPRRRSRAATRRWRCAAAATATSRRRSSGRRWRSRSRWPRPTSRRGSGRRGRSGGRSSEASERPATAKRQGPRCSTAVCLPLANVGDAAGGPIGVNARGAGHTRSTWGGPASPYRRRDCLSTACGQLCGQRVDYPIWLWKPPICPS